MIDLLRPNSAFRANHLTWTVERDERTFTARVVEPADYDPPSHGRLFEQLITLLLVGEINPAGGAPLALPGGRRVDLLTFPEAFAPVSSLIAVFEAVPRFGQMGCIHVGLRPGSDGRHLFRTSEVRDLVARISALDHAVPEDLAPFRDWLEGQADGRMFNLGCLFAKDDRNRLRVCLHPKVVRSRVEHSAIPDQDMDEANLISLVTLRPSNAALLSVTLQPLICSDALNISTARGTPGPLAAINGSDWPWPPPPDHIDLVSLVTCTPQVERELGETRARLWHEAFRKAFTSASFDGDRQRHHFATFVLANFENTPAGPGGLSGLYQPLAIAADGFPPGIGVSIYGKSVGKDQRWSEPTESTGDWERRAYLATLDPAADANRPAVRVLGFRLPNMIRDWIPGRPPLGPSRLNVLTGRWGPGEQLYFDDWSIRS